MHIAKSIRKVRYYNIYNYIIIILAHRRKHLKNIDFSHEKLHEAFSTPE